MQDQDSAKATQSNGMGFIGYAGPRFLFAVVLTAALLGGTAYLLNHFDIRPATLSEATGHAPSDPGSALNSPAQSLETAKGHPNDTPHKETAIQPLDAPDMHSKKNLAGTVSENPSKRSASAITADQAHLPAKGDAPTEGHQLPEAHGADVGAKTQKVPLPDTSAGPQSQNGDPGAGVQPDHPTLPPADGTPPIRHFGQEQRQAHRRAGVAFVAAIIKPMDNELNQRFFGWRPNDIFNMADNTKNYQMGILEVTRRTIDYLAAHMSRTGHTDAFNPYVENAVNGFKADAERYWFPSPETRYREGLKELEAYKQALMEGKAKVDTRTVNLIPLLKAYEKLLESCDEDLVKHTEMDGSKVSMFKADNYFYYAKGVASSLSVILEAIHHDFAKALESQNVSELLHHAVDACNEAADLSPWFITDSDLDGLFANHRANMAVPLSHARTYLNQLIKALST